MAGWRFVAFQHLRNVVFDTTFAEFSRDLGATLVGCHSLNEYSLRWCWSSCWLMLSHLLPPGPPNTLGPRLLHGYPQTPLFPGSVNPPATCVPVYNCNCWVGLHLQRWAVSGHHSSWLQWLLTKKGKKLGHQHTSPTSTTLDCNNYLPRRGKHMDTDAHPQRLLRSSPGHLQWCSVCDPAKTLGQIHFAEPNQHVLTYLHPILIWRVTYWALVELL